MSKFRWRVFVAPLLAALALGRGTAPAVPLAAQTPESVVAVRDDRIRSPLAMRANLIVEGVEVEDALEALRSGSRAPLAFSPSFLPRGLEVSCACARLSVGEALDRLLAGTELRYATVRGQILIEPARPQGELPSQALLASRPAAPVERGRSSVGGHRAAGILVGVVSDASTGTPLPGASVAVEGTQLGAISAQDGRYTLTGVPAGSHRVRASRIGYAAQTQIATVVDGGTATANFALAQQAISLEGVVAVGYGTQRKKDVTGAVSSIDAEAATRAAPIVNVQQAMQGRVAGVQVTQASSEPGGGVRIRIRGSGSINASNDPLYVIDGLPVGGDGGVVSNARPTLVGRNPLNALNPNDVASIEILKDAAATAIYGARGANGVVLITTKKGRTGGLQIDYDGFAGMQEVTKKMDVLNAQEYMRLQNDLRAGQNQSPAFSPDEIANAGEGTDWQDEIFQAAPIQSHQVAFGGGSATSKYYASFGYFEQEGVVRTSGIERYSVRLNTSQETGAFRFGVNFNTSVIEDAFAPIGVGGNMAAGAVYTALQVPPVLAVRDAGGMFTDPKNDINNPVALIEGFDETARTTRIFGNAFGEYDLLGGLTARLNLGTDRFSTRHDTYESRLTLLGAAAGGVANVETIDASTDLAELTLSLDRVYDQHHLTMLGGATYQVFRNRSFETETQGFPSDVTGTDNLALGASYLRPSSFRSQNQLLSYLGRLNYDYAGTYLATATIRADGSSRFGENSKFGYFPSLALGWRISEAPILRDVGFLDDLKLRASYGVTGNQEIGNYRSLLLLRAGRTAVWGGAPIVGTEPSRIPNPDLKWERTAQFNTGVDFALLGSRITGVAEYYLKETNDLLLDFPLPLSTGFVSITRNAGAVRNEGVELSLNTVNLEGQVGWTSGFTFATVRNRVVDLAGAREVVMGSEGISFVPAFTIIREGAPLNAFYGYKVEGIVQQGETVPGRPGVAPRPGELKIRDVDGDGVITPSDRMILGSPFPDFTFGINNSLTRGPLELRLFIQGVQGQKVFNVNWGFSDYPINVQRNRLAEPVRNRWSPSNPTNEQPSFVDPTRWAGDMANSRAVQDASYARLQNVTLTYDLPARLLGERVRTARVYVAGQNLLTLTDYAGYDPDVSVRGSSNVLLDYSAYPLARTFTAGLNLGF